MLEPRGVGGKGEQEGNREGRDRVIVEVRRPDPKKDLAVPGT